MAAQGSSQSYLDYLGLGLGVLGLTVGAILLYDDYKDLSDTAREDHPSPLHHWQVGAALLAAGSGATAYFAARLLGLLPPAQQQPQQQQAQPAGLAAALPPGPPRRPARAPGTILG